MIIANDRRKQVLLRAGVPESLLITVDKRDELKPDKVYVKLNNLTSDLNEYQIVPVADGFKEGSCYVYASKDGDNKFYYIDSKENPVEFTSLTCMLNHMANEAYFNNVDDTSRLNSLCTELKKSSYLSKELPEKPLTPFVLEVCKSSVPSW